MLGYSVSSYDREEPFDIVAERQQKAEDTKQKINEALGMITEALSDWDLENNTNLLDRYCEGEDIQELITAIG